MSESSKLYSIPKMVDIAIEKYRMNPKFRSTYLQEFRRVIKDHLKLWDSGKEKTIGKNKTKVFTEEQMQKVFSCQRIYDYVRNNSIDKTIQDSERYNQVQEKIWKQREKYISYLYNQEEIDFSVPLLSSDEIRRQKYLLMLESIFNLFFGEFNDDLFEYDQNTVFYADELNLSPEVIDSKNRLSNPNGVYFSDISLDKIIKRIAKEIAKEITKAKN